MLKIFYENITKVLTLYIRYYIIQERGERYGRGKKV